MGMEDFWEQLPTGKEDKPLLFEMGPLEYDFHDIDGLYFMLDRRLSGCLLMMWAKPMNPDIQGTVTLDSRVVSGCINQYMEVMGNMWVLGIPLLAIPMIMMGLFTSYDLTFGQCFKNALVIIANNAVFTTIVGVLSAAPLALLSVNKTLGVIISIAMALIGCTFMALCWIALADRGMVKCHNKKVAQDKTEKYEQRKAAKQNPYANGAQKAQNAGQKKKNQPAKPYQNPKKKKKK